MNYIKFYGLPPIEGKNEKLVLLLIEHCSIVNRVNYK